MGEVRKRGKFFYPGRECLARIGEGRAQDSVRGSRCLFVRPAIEFCRMELQVDNVYDTGRKGERGWWDEANEPESIK